MSRQQDVVALDVAVNGLVDVKVLETLRGIERERINDFHMTPVTLVSGVCERGSELRPSAGHHSPWAPHAGCRQWCLHPSSRLSSAGLWPGPSLSHRYRASAKVGGGGGGGGTKLNMSQHVLPENNAPKSRAFEAWRKNKRKKKNIWSQDFTV